MNRVTHIDTIHHGDLDYCITYQENGYDDGYVLERVDYRNKGVPDFWVMLTRMKTEAEARQLAHDNFHLAQQQARKKKERSSGYALQDQGDY